MSSQREPVNTSTISIELGSMSDSPETCSDIHDNTSYAPISSHVNSDECGKTQINLVLFGLIKMPTITTENQRFASGAKTVLSKTGNAQASIKGFIVGCLDTTVFYTKKVADKVADKVVSNPSAKKIGCGVIKVIRVTCNVASMASEAIKKLSPPRMIQEEYTNGDGDQFLGGGYYPNDEDSDDDNLCLYDDDEADEADEEHKEHEDEDEDFVIVDGADAN